MKFRSTKYPSVRLTAGNKSLKFEDGAAETSDEDLIKAADASPDIERAEDQGDNETPSLESMSRPELNELAAIKGVEEPEKLRSKPEVIEAIQTAEANAAAND